jgi:diguanylate cyclase (GGDEF)-like protein
VHTDGLTGLFNRRYMTRQISAHINNAGRHQLPLSLLLADIDHFKLINDSLGHAEGDRALALVAGAINRRIRDIDVAGRWGGDEFLVLLPSTTGAEAMIVADGISRAVRELTDGPDLTLSVGCAQWGADDAAGLVERADRALYDVKGTGRDGVMLAPERVLSIEVATPPVAADPAFKPLRVVLVDDVEGIRGLMRVTLEGSAIEVVGEAQDGEEAMMVVRQTRPDVVVMDWNMPGMDGIQGTRALRAEYPQAMVVACTSSDEPRIQLAMRKAGAVAHFSKNDLADLAAFLGELQNSGRLAS